MSKFLKVVTIVLLIVSLNVVISGCSSNNIEFYEEYFNNFSSVQPFEAAVSQINLDSNVSVDSYDSTNEIFITKKYFNNQYSTSEDDSTILLYGIATLEEELISPIYSNVISINGDFAIVTKPCPYYDSSTGETSLINIIGVVKYRGENAGDLTDFTDTDCEYNEYYYQFSFVGDYIAVPGIKSYPTPNTTYSTFYDYKTNDKLLEAFKVGCDFSYDFLMYDGILIAEGAGTAYFFDVTKILQNGFLSLGDYDTYKAFPEDEDDEYTDSIYIHINYLGNGWFVRTARLESDTEFVGYNIQYETYDVSTEEATTMYARIRTDFYNFNSKSSFDNDWLLVDTVANEYTSIAYANTSDALNNLAIVEDDRYAYYVPVLNPAEFVKDGYSIVYFYYLPYIDDGDYTYEISFCIIDDNANIICMEDILMPLAFVDGIGIQNIDPTYESLFGDMQYTTYNNEEVCVCPITDGENTFETYYYQNDVIIGTEYNFTDATVYFGAYNVTTSTLLLPFIYEELTPYYGDYSIGVRYNENVITNYRIDKEGNETELSDVVNIRQGVYVFEKDGLLGVKNYAGDVLVDASYDALEVYDVFNCGDDLQKSFVIATSGTYTYIYTLE
jgi:hypothetical protein